jgi:hypothetical protein
VITNYYLPSDARGFFFSSHKIQQSHIITPPKEKKIDIFFLFNEIKHESGFIILV